MAQLFFVMSPVRPCLFIFFMYLYTMVDPGRGVPIEYCSHFDGFNCGNDECIEKSQICDGTNNCGNNADEENCENCSQYAFNCGHGKCIEKSQVCDGINDCGDNADEENCDDCMSATGNREFACGGNSTKCIYDDHRCDGHQLCPNGEDELNCENFCHDTRGHLCPNSSMCVDSSRVCNDFKTCPDGSDEQRCGPDDCLSTTGNRGFACGGNSTQCINDYDRCDGYQLCRNGGDELNCEYCSDGNFKCDNGKCIPDSYVCNFFYNCEDHSDEGPVQNCEYACPNSTFKSLWVCDGINDCEDNSDEENCENFCHETGGHLCPNSSMCVESSRLCNGIKDCSDGSDEQICGGKFDCGGGIYINNSQVCDESWDCNNGRDEGCWCPYIYCKQPEPSFGDKASPCKRCHVYDKFNRRCDYAISNCRVAY